MTNIQPITTQPEDTIYDITVFGETVFSARQTGLYRSDNSGVNWENALLSLMSDSPIPTITVGLSPNYEQDKTIIAGINGGTVISTDGGATWIVHQFRKPIPMVTSIGISPNFETDQTVLAGTYEDGMFRSIDAGKTWQAFNFGLFDHNVLCIAVSPKFDIDKTVYIGTSSGIYKSLNASRLWQDLTVPIGYDAVLSLALADNGTVYAGTESNGLIKSKDHGMTWARIYKTDSAINSIVVASDNRLIAQFDDSVMISDDDGTTWTSVISKNVNIAILSDDKQSIIAGLADTSIQHLNL